MPKCLTRLAGLVKEPAAKTEGPMFPSKTSMVRKENQLPQGTHMSMHTCYTHARVKQLPRFPVTPIPCAKPIRTPQFRP